MRTGYERSSPARALTFNAATLGQAARTSSGASTSRARSRETLPPKRVRWRHVSLSTQEWLAALTEPAFAIGAAGSAYTPREQTGQGLAKATSGTRLLADSGTEEVALRPHRVVFPDQIPVDHVLEG